MIIFITGCVNQKITLTDKYYNEGKYIEITSEEINNNKTENYVIFAYNSYCNFSVPCETVFKKTMEKFKIDFLSIKIDEFKKTYLNKIVKYAPTIIIVKKGKVIAYLDSNKDKDIKKYEDDKQFEKWLNNYIKFNN